MCGRYLLATSPEEVAAMFGYPERPNFPVRYNIAPTQPIAIVIAADGQSPPARAFRLARWGLWPSWVKDVKDFPTLINARSEQAAEKPAFRAAMRRRRCLIPADGFYEWQGSVRGKKQPHVIRRPGGALFAFAGLWETYMDPGGSEVDTVTILTTSANATLMPLHHRMPVVILPEQFDRWLDTTAQSPDDVADLLVPAQEDFFQAYPVAPRVNAVANDDPGLIAPIADSDTPPASEPPSRAAKAEAKAQADHNQLSLFGED
jgi:putative SOS response-associated peptidase YedK